MTEEINLGEEEYWQLREVAVVEDRSEVVNILDVDGREISGRASVAAIRGLAAGMLESGAAEAYGFDKMEPIYDRASRELFPESFEEEE